MMLRRMQVLASGRGLLLVHAAPATALTLFICPSGSTLTMRAKTAAAVGKFQSWCVDVPGSRFVGQCWEWHGVSTNKCEMWTRSELQPA